jgi:hypothetical protein
VIAGWPVQFLPPTSPLVEEALGETQDVDVEGEPASVFSGEHLAAIALQTNSQGQGAPGAVRGGWRARRGPSRRYPLAAWSHREVATARTASPRRYAMTFQMREILKSKQALRRRLATMPIAEKLRLLDELRERTLTIIASRKSQPRHPR